MYCIATSLWRRARRREGQRGRAGWGRPRRGGGRSGIGGCGDYKGSAFESHESRPAGPIRARSAPARRRFMRLPRPAASWSATMRLGLKLALVGFLLLLLLIPLMMLRGLVAERQMRGAEVADEVAAAAAGPPRIVGPLLLVEATRDVQRKRVVERAGVPVEEVETVVETVWYLVPPDTLAIDNALRTERRGRSLFQVLLYHDALRLQGEVRHRVPAF